jgi:BlaI family penicillinase repressor
MAPRESDLGTAELEVLKALWEHGPATVREVLNHLHEQGRKPAYTTVLTHLTRLEQKGFVKSDKSGVAYVYRPAVTRARITKSRLRSLIEQLYDGDAAPLVLQLMREQKFSPDEIAELQALIDRLDAKRKPRSSKP